MQIYSKFDADKYNQFIEPKIVDGKTIVAFEPYENNYDDENVVTMITGDIQKMSFEDGALVKDENGDILMVDDFDFTIITVDEFNEQVALDIIHSEIGDNISSINDLHIVAPEEPAKDSHPDYPQIYNKHIVKIERDEYAEDPFTFYDNVVNICMDFNSSRNYKTTHTPHDATLEKLVDDMKKEAKKQKKPFKINDTETIPFLVEKARELGFFATPIFVYDHSGRSFSVSNDRYPFNDRWDSAMNGIAWMSPNEIKENKMTEQDALKSVQSMLDMKMNWECGGCLAVGYAPAVQIEGKEDAACALEDFEWVCNFYDLESAKEHLSGAITNEETATQTPQP